MRLAVVWPLFAVSAVRAESGEAPTLTANDILHAVREGQASRHEALDGQLRNDEDGKVFPFRLVADGPLVRYQFSGNPPTAVQVQYNEENSELQESTGATTEKLTPTNFDKKILGTDLAYEDLALRFVYWSKATLEGEDTIRTPCRVETPAQCPEPSDPVFQRQLMGRQGKRRAAAGRCV